MFSNPRTPGTYVIGSCGSYKPTTGWFCFEACDKCTVREDITIVYRDAIKGKVIAIPKEYRMDRMPAEIEKLWAHGTAMLKDAGARIRDITLPHTKYTLPAYYVIAPAEASSKLARYDSVRFGERATLEAGEGITEMYEKTRAAGFGAEVQHRFMVGTYVLTAGCYDAYYSWRISDNRMQLSLLLTGWYLKPMVRDRCSWRKRTSHVGVDSRSQRIQVSVLSQVIRIGNKTADVVLTGW